jgi:hypothetical protein
VNERLSTVMVVIADNFLVFKVWTASRTLTSKRFKSFFRSTVLGEVRV